MRFLFPFFVLACGTSIGTPPPPGGWANLAPTRVERTVDDGEHQLLDVRQGELHTWIRVPDVDASVGDYVLLSQGTPRLDVPIPDTDDGPHTVVDIPHARVVDKRMAERVVAARKPAKAIAIETVYAKLDGLEGSEVVVEGTVMKSTGAVGWNWVHVQDGSGRADVDTHDLTIQTQEVVRKGERVAFRGRLSKDVNLGFGYQYNALLEGGILIRGR